MDFGSGGVGLWVPYVPMYRGNRALPAEERLSLEIKLFRPVDQIALFQETDDTVLRWRDENLKAWMEKPEYGPQIRRMSIDVLRLCRLFAEHTRGYRHFRFDGQEVTDPIELFLQLPRPPATNFIQEMSELLSELNEAEWDTPQEALDWGEAYQARLRLLLNQPREKGLIQEIREAIESTIGLTGDELKNCVCSFAGNTSAINGVPTGEPTVHAPAETPDSTVATSPEKEMTAL